MKRQDFDDLVRRVEARYRGRPAALERAMAAWVALGMAGILAWLGLLFLLGAAAFALGAVLPSEAALVLLGVGVLLIVYGLSQAALFLLVESAPPDGRQLRPGEAPALIAMLDALARAVQCRPFDEVRISLDFNAGVREVPRLGILGRPRSILEIGLPLMMALTPEELRAVLAHEFVHLSARHGRSGSRIHRLHRTWGSVMQRLQRTEGTGSEGAIRWAVSGFAGCYWPRLQARSLVLSRVHEYHSDRVAAGVAEGPALASALWRMECVTPWLSERFWPDLHRESDQLPEPPSDVLGRMRAAFETPPAPEDAARWIGRGLDRATIHDATHPAFADRARALGLPIDDLRDAGFPPVARPSAAEALLGADLDPIERELAAEWRSGAQAAWRERHRRAAAEAKRRQSPARAEAPADSAALWESARKEIELRGIAPAEPMLRAVLAQAPDHAGASVVLGQHLLRLGDPEGERLLLNVVEKADEGWMSRACDVLQEHYRATGQVDRLGEVRARLDRHEVAIAASQRERKSIEPHDPFLPHGLADGPIARLHGLLASEPDCGAAWLVRKDLRHFPERPLFVLCVQGKSTRWGSGRAEAEGALVKRLIPRVALPGQVLVIAGHGPFRKLARAVMAIPGAEVYRWDRPELSGATT